MTLALWLACGRGFLAGCWWASRGNAALRLRVAMLTNCVTVLADELQERAVFRRRVEDGLVLTDGETAEVWQQVNNSTQHLRD